jgi:hypothetical protein
MALLRYLYEALLGLVPPNKAKEGFLMRNRPSSEQPREGRFQKIVAAFLAQPGLPFASVLSAERVERVFGKHDNLFGKDAIYSTVLTLWAFLRQALREGKQASCQAAVAEVVAHQQQAGLPVPSEGRKRDGFDIDKIGKDAEGQVQVRICLICQSEPVPLSSPAFVSLSRFRLPGRLCLERLSHPPEWIATDP